MTSDPYDYLGTAHSLGMKYVGEPHSLGMKYVGEPHSLGMKYVGERQPLPDPDDEIQELLQQSLDNFEDDIENRPMRHSIGNLIARLRTVLKNRRSS